MDQQRQRMAKRLARAVRVAVEVTKALAEKESSYDSCPLCHVEGFTTHDGDCLIRIAADSRPKVGEQLLEQLAAILWSDGVDDGERFEDERLEQIAALLRNARTTIVPAEPAAAQPAEQHAPS